MRSWFLSIPILLMLEKPAIAQFGFNVGMFLYQEGATSSQMTNCLAGIGPSGLYQLTSYVDPLDGQSKELLLVAGTAGDDRINISYLGIGNVSVTANNVLLGQFSPPPDLVLVCSGDGADLVEVRSMNNAIVVVNGGAGDDILYGGQQIDILFGGPGNDSVHGDARNDFLVGGEGSDLLFGNANNPGSADRDILIGGNSSYDNDYVSIAQIVQLWSRTDLAYAARLSELKGGAGAPSLTIDKITFDNAAIDVLRGHGGEDWFLINPSSADQTPDRQSPEVVN